MAIHHLLEGIRRNPAAGGLLEPSLSALWHVICGYECALGIHRIKDDWPLPGDFTEWVAYRLHYRSSTRGWRMMIFETTGSEAAGFARFFELLEEHSRRQSHVVARLTGFERTFKVGPVGHEHLERVERYPDISLVTFTDDPGFFVIPDKPGRHRFPRNRFYHSLQWFESSHGVDRSRLAVLDQERLDQWGREAEPVAPPNRGPADPLGNSGVGGVRHR